MKPAEINWQLTTYCEYDCFYCPSKWRGGTLTRTLDEYLLVVEKLQQTRYLHHEKINWVIKGGEPLHFPNLNQLLQQIKTKPSKLRVDTSGGDSWFNIMEVIGYIDDLRLTHHYWQNFTVVNYIVDMCKDMNKLLRVTVPLQPGAILESRAKVAELVSQGIRAEEQKLVNSVGGTWDGYSKKDRNLIRGLPEDYEDPPAPPIEKVPYVDLSIPDDSPFYTGMPCYAGIDWIFIDSRGHAVASECRGRPIGNVFEENWEAPAQPFPCSMIQCRNQNDRNNIRVIQS